MLDEANHTAFGLERREWILNELRRVGSVRVVELSRTLGVADLTIRRDLRDLADKGLITRVHGGATLRSRLDTTVPVGTHTPGPPRFRVGMVIPSLSYYWPQIVIGARAAATDAGVQLVLRGASYSVDDQARQMASLVKSGGIHGLIVAPETSGTEGAGILRWLEAMPTPIVLVERRAPVSLALTRTEWVTTDHSFGGALAARHLAAAGHTRIGIVTDSHSPTSARLRQGWEPTTSELSIESTLDLEVSMDDLSAVQRIALVDEILDRCAATGTTALLIHSDRQAIMIQQQAIDRGLQMPGDLAIIAYDDELAASGEHPITALRPPKQQVGRVAIETMVARLSEGARRPVQRVELLPSLHVRESTPSGHAVVQELSASGTVTA